MFAGKLLENGWQGDAEGAAEGIDAWAGRGARAGATAVLFDLDGAQVDEIVDDVGSVQWPAMAAGEAVR